MPRRIPMTERVIFRLTPADRRLIEAAAEARGDRLSDYLRDALRDRAREDLSLVGNQAG